MIILIFFLNLETSKVLEVFENQKKMHRSIFIFNDCMRVCIYYPID